MTSKIAWIDKSVWECERECARVSERDKCGKKAKQIMIKGNHLSVLAIFTFGPTEIRPQTDFVTTYTHTHAQRYVINSPHI